LSATVVDSPAPPWKGIPWIYASTISFYLAGAVFYLYLARVLPTDELGSIVVVLAIAYIASTAAVLGLGTAFQHFLSYSRGRSELETVRRLKRMAFGAALILPAIAAGVVFALAGPLSQFFFHDARYTSLIQLFGIFAALTTASSILQSVLIGLQRFIAYSVVFATSAVGTYGVPMVLIQFWPGVQTVAVGCIVGSVVGLLVCLAMLLRPDTDPSLGAGSAAEGPTDLRRLLRRMLTYSLPVFAASLISASASYVDRLVLASLVDLSTVGIYNYAILISSGSLVLVAPFSTVLVPRLSHFFGTNEATAIRSAGRTSTTLAVLVYVPLALAIAALGPFLLRYLVGPGFVAASLPLAVILSITALAIPFTILTSVASGIRRTSALLHSSALALTANVGLSVLLVPSFGMLGAAIGNSSMYWVVFLVLYLELRSTQLVQFDLRSIGRIWAASLLMFVAMLAPLEAYGYGPLHVLLFTVVGFIVLLVALRLTRALSRDAALTLAQSLPVWAGVARPVVFWIAAGDSGSRASGALGGRTPIESLRK
jgi:O-antigen/teichoic acid export membrane protein